MKKTCMVKRFWVKVNKTPTCWEWTASRRAGYGAFWLDGKHHLAHRISWSLAGGKCPDDLCVLHKCDNRICVRPGHLFLGSKGDNNRDRARKRRSRNQAGEKNNMTKLTWDTVREIRERYKAGEVTQAKLGVQFGVVRSAIGHIVRGERWKE